MARVLVIDDEPDVRWLIRMSLERAGHEVIDAEDGLRGVALAQRQRPQIIVLDLMMPVMDGYAVLEALAKDDRTASVPVVVLSARATRRGRASHGRRRPAVPREAVRPRPVGRGAERAARGRLTVSS
jgi:CheY-like chemotaxis protein